MITNLIMRKLFIDPEIREIKIITFKKWKNLSWEIFIESYINSLSSEFIQINVLQREVGVGSPLTRILRRFTLPSISHEGTNNIYVLGNTAVDGNLQKMLLWVKIKMCYKKNELGRKWETCTMENYTFSSYHHHAKMSLHMLRDLLIERLFPSQTGCPLTLVVFTLFPEEQLHPFRSGRTLHSSPSRHGCIWHHHFCSTIEATGDRKTNSIFSIWAY